MNPIWIEDPRRWQEVDIVFKLQYLMNYLCTGPCGQSSHVLAQRTATRETLREAINEIEYYRNYIGEGINSDN